jgi:uncharacterized membrane protein
MEVFIPFPITRTSTNHLPERKESIVDITKDATIAILIAMVVIILAYAKSPTWKDKVIPTIALISIPISAVTIWFTKGFWDFVITTDPTTIYRLAIIPFLILSYCMIFSIFIFFTAWKKKGFHKLNKNSENGLFFGLIVGLVFGLFGLVFGLIIGMIDGPIGGLTGGLSLGLVFGLIFGLIFEYQD